MTKAEAFAAKHDIAATSEDVTRIRRALSRFYDAVEAIDPVRRGWIQLHDRPAIMTAFERHQHAGTRRCNGMAEMPQHWPTTYRASVCYYLAPLLADVVNS
ncbi:hypothetical protein PYH37_000395 [Sinorhizobium numidicum]|uniref:Uncharacterized protein n=1 Tax=Sinorhizobium numidicum TaxID=680248 RepID=A0ABY8CVQ1_9HYPH|nr:hypothetical protein [Sinorhizobium numidicum]WEX75062.1 hypothetical protein PYH37_000395 [Sinorhizobium numidicum]WEX81056.1 hypothetical protein PYH38_000397 [Sinorhizobium numidicum]